MSYPYLFSLKEAVTSQFCGTDLILANGSQKKLILTNPSAALIWALEALAARMVWESELVTGIREAPSSQDRLHIKYLLKLLKGKGWLCYTCRLGDHTMATLEPFGEGFVFKRQRIHGFYRLSRFAYLRREGNAVIIECPLGHGKILLTDPLSHLLLAVLATPADLDMLIHALPTESKEAQSSSSLKEDISAFLDLLINIGAVMPCHETGLIATEQERPLGMWPFHDLLFHSRSRAGWCDNTTEDKLISAQRGAPLPGAKAPVSSRIVMLARPVTGETSKSAVSFFSLLDARRSKRRKGKTPMHVEELGLFLYYTGCARESLPVDTAKGYPCEASLRPCPSGGAIHEIEYYLTIARCRGIASGFYRYNPFEHCLEYLGGLASPHEKLLADAGAALGECEPDILITLAARFQRTTWKYGSLSYSLILKNVGAIFQQMYLVATALHLAPCALGNGNALCFAEASGLDSYTEGAVGEFALSSCDD